MPVIETLRAEFSTDPIGRGYASMTDAERLASLYVEDQLGELTETPLSFRSLMGELAPAEYLTARSVLTSAASSSALVADAVAILANVGEWASGGLDFGSANTQAMIDQLFTGDNAALGTKLKNLGRAKMSRLSAILPGENATIADVAAARSES